MRRVCWLKFMTKEFSRYLMAANKGNLQTQKRLAEMCIEMG